MKNFCSHTKFSDSVVDRGGPTPQKTLGHFEPPHAPFNVLSHPVNFRADIACDDHLYVAVTGRKRTLGLNYSATSMTSEAPSLVIKTGGRDICVYVL